jgi:hypothetical protein
MKYKVKLSPRSVLAGRFPCAIPEITVLVRTSLGNAKLRFVVDTGADITTIPMWLAQQERIDVSPHAIQGSVTGLHGQTVGKVCDLITFQIAGVRYQWPCDFILSPPTQRRIPVLGRAGFLREFAVCIDDEYLKITCRNRSRSWWRRWWYKLRYNLFPLSWDAAQPLGEPRR